MDLNLSIPSSFGSVSLKDCLEEYTKTERMEKIGYRCQNKKCKAIDKMEKDITIFRFPKILVIHLKRFSRREKITKTVDIPSKLDMRSYAPNSSHNSKDIAGSYKLYGMSQHSGSLNGGHYVAQVRDMDDGQWYDCNDDYVGTIRSASLSSSSAYVLFYTAI